MGAWDSAILVLSRSIASNSSPILFFSARTTALSIAFSNSRTLPGHAYLAIAWLALSLKFNIDVFNRRQVFCKMASAISRISLPLSRNGGIRRAITFIR